MKLLPIKWYIESPIDFEHKSYILLGYLTQVDHSFNKKKLSPHLLHLESIIDELTSFKDAFINTKAELNKRRYKYFDNPHLTGENNEILNEVYHIVDFSIPRVESRIELGNYIMKKHNQLLY